MIEKVDAVIVGGGPVGLLIAYQLTKFGCKPYIIDQDDKPSMSIYGRACTLWPRTLEILDQLELLDALLELGVISKTGMNFRDGKLAPGGLVFGYRMDKHGDTVFKFALHLRQRLIEQTFESALHERDVCIHFQHRLENYAVNEDKDDAYPVHCVIQDLKTDSTYEVHGKYIIGADGGRSIVRALAGIEFPGTRTTSKWIRMDAVIETDMPNPRALNSVQSAHHGLVLWCPIDGGRTRLGFVFSPELQAKYGSDGVTQEVAMEEAKKALYPFSINFVTVDWFTLYGIGQRIASTFYDASRRVLLAGDACHTHSSGSAQGLNTGTHDAVNIGWKLAMTLKGLVKDDVLLRSYDEERRANVQQVIDNDVIIATLISGNYPEKFKGRTESPRDLLTEWFDKASTQEFTLGLGISYASTNLVNNSRDDRPLATIPIGARGPDAYVSRVGTGERLRLQRLLLNTGVFHVVIFAGSPSHTLSQLQSLRATLDSPNNFALRFPRNICKLTTIIAGEGIGAQEAMLGVRPFGRAYFDVLRETHEVYGVDVWRGAIVVFRPDGYVAMIVPLQASDELATYFGRFLKRSAV